MLQFFSTAPDYMVQGKDAFGDNGFVVYIHNGEWRLLMI